MDRAGQIKEHLDKQKLEPAEKKVCSLLFSNFQHLIDEIESKS